MGISWLYHLSGDFGAAFRIRFWLHGVATLAGGLLHSQDDGTIPGDLVLENHVEFPAFHVFFAVQKCIESLIYS